MFIRNFLSEFFSGPLPKSMLLIGLSGLKIWVYVTSCKKLNLDFFTNLTQTKFKTEPMLGNGPFLAYLAF